MAEVGHIFSKLKEVIHISQPDKVRTTNFLFRLHGKLTSTLLILTSCLIFVQHYITKSYMSCLVPPDEDIRSSALNQYCFIAGTYTVPSLYNSLKLSAHVGVGPQIKGQERKFHHYFQWVPFVLLIQGVLFYLPYLIWKSCENGRVQAYCNLKMGDNISMKTRRFTTVSAEGHQEVDKTMRNVGIYFVKSLGFNKTYSIWFVVCEVLNFGVVLLTFWTTDWFLVGQFQNFGIEWLRYMRNKHSVADGNFLEEELLISPLDKIFPKVSKCEFRKFGPSGSIINYDLLCIITSNIVNEKIYLVLWFWLASLMLMGGIVFIYRVTLFMFPTARNYLMLKRSVRKEERTDLKKILNQIEYSDWFILKKISDNLDRLRFGDLCKAIRNAKESVNRFPVFDHRPTLISTDKTIHTVDIGYHDVDEGFSLETGCLLPDQNRPSAPNKYDLC